MLIEGKGTVISNSKVFPCIFGFYFSESCCEHSKWWESFLEENNGGLSLKDTLCASPHSMAAFMALSISCCNALEILCLLGK